MTRGQVRIVVVITISLLYLKQGRKYRNFKNYKKTVKPESPLIRVIIIFCPLVLHSQGLRN